MSDDQPVIEERENGPLVVKQINDMRLADGSEAQCKPVMALCRCGDSSNKPFCDGTHKENGFDSTPSDVASKDRINSYEGSGVTVYYNKLLCSHAGECVRRAGAIFDPKQRPWIQPDNGTVDDVREVVKACPSGALRWSEPGSDAELLAKSDISITIEKNGPYRVSNIPIAAGHWAEGQSAKKYVLCRCGKSGNKPFCDGAHLDQGWSDGD